MEKNHDKKEELIDINKIFNLYSNISSNFFINLFKDSIKNITINKEKDDPIFIFINIILIKIQQIILTLCTEVQLLYYLKISFI